ncbi:tRNA(Ile2)-agmatinylcytidine synthase [Methanohalophilus levihalophilus]|uniref:tRNA(Ile)(2)-agmatinylcytidine synthase n=1 Tax=Methanohalophilus levihalophilus TaxID=1431282 RepID=UPI001AE5A46E|nr:tRNA(Ile)(2)-agmatinylcytidine synthase [Methanohalophilus levihalophilus]MBP2030567.1 tRNA(Ile2)-agmatinylcytidine synthase [Methanohalophilus levihalophilus]
MIIAFDDTDSRNTGMCTTYLGALLFEELQQYGKITNEPLLIRLNPTIPYKTRGNAAVALQIETERPEEVISHVIERVEDFAQFQDENTNPGVVFIHAGQVESCREELANFFLETVRQVITIDRAKEIISRNKLEARGYKNGRGLIGALAASGAALAEKWDYTYELLAYRQPENWGTLRRVDDESVWKADNATYPETWDNVDMSNNLVVCVPHSVDPVLYGIRGKNKAAIRETADTIEGENTERTLLYRTNQGTDMHLIPASFIEDLQDLHSYTIQLKVTSIPHTIEGGHTFFQSTDERGNTIDCAAFEPTKNFRELVRKLIPEDIVVLSGSVKEGTFNIEKLEIKKLETKSELVNPTCSSCGKKMKSAGKNQGYRCRNCKTTASELEMVEIPRELEIGIYEVPPCARRHLSMPLIRRDKDGYIHPSR